MSAIAGIRFRPLDIDLTRALPRSETTVAVTLLAAISLAPGLLPRSAPLQAVLTGLLVTFGVACAGVAGRFLGARRKPGPARTAVAALGAIGIG